MMNQLTVLLLYAMVVSWFDVWHLFFWQNHNRYHHNQ